MNLENLNLVELNAREVQETEGGIFPIVIGGIIITKKAAAWIAGCAIGAGIGYLAEK